MDSEAIEQPARAEHLARRRVAGLAAWSAGVALTGAVATRRAHGTRVTTGGTALDLPPTTTAPSTAPSPAPDGGTVVATGPATTAPPAATAPVPGEATALGSTAGEPTGPLAGDAYAAHVGRRLSFGLTPALLDEIRAAGPDAWIEQQLRPYDIDDGAVDGSLAQLDGLWMSADQMHRRYLFDEKAVGDLRLAQAIRATRSRRHLLEVVVDLWHDRFAASMAKAAVDQHLPTYDRQAIRPYALGRFADLLRAVTLSGAMLEYLDGARSTAERPNENHARELLELHTVGRDAGFTQADVVGASKVLSGWTLDSRLNVVFDGSRHDGGPATVLGWSTPGHPGPGGNVDVFSMLDHLAAHPATARRVADLFARRFVADDPPAGVVDAGTDAFLRTGGDLAATLRAVLATDAFRSGTPMFRRGFDALAAMMRAAGTTVDNGTGLLRLLRARHDARAALYWLEGQLGQVTFRAPNPAGHRLRGSSWLSGDSLLTRWQTAAYIAAGQLPGLPTDARALSGGAATAGGAVDAIARQCFAQPPAPATRAAALRAMAQGENEAPSDDTCRGALAFLLAAPELQVR